MNHDQELLYEELVGRSTYQRRGPIAEFLDKKEAEQAPRTYLSYLSSLTRFREVADEDATVGDFDERLAHRFITELRKRQLSKNTIATYVRDLKAFGGWLDRTGWTERNRLAELKRPEFVRPKFDTLTPEQKQAILAPWNPRTFLGARNLAFLALFMDTGLRREELAHLEDKRVHLREATSRSSATRPRSGGSSRCHRKWWPSSTTTSRSEPASCRDYASIAPGRAMPTIVTGLRGSSRRRRSSGHGTAHRSPGT
ncbi:MAG: phage integrase N-terminal SAM-like domain-containing protein, partial [Chloroflexota bacterium]|nr:phage integrase N-terminal SAM-like domain-containing protein [Chloroflexota bacterium]